MCQTKTSDDSHIIAAFQILQAIGRKKVCAIRLVHKALLTNSHGEGIEVTTDEQLGLFTEVRIGRDISRKGKKFKFIFRDNSIAIERRKPLANKGDLKVWKVLHEVHLNQLRVRYNELAIPQSIKEFHVWAANYLIIQAQKDLES